MFELPPAIPNVLRTQVIFCIHNNSPPFWSYAHAPKLSYLFLQKLSWCGGGGFGFWDTRYENLYSPSRSWTSEACCSWRLDSSKKAAAPIVTPAPDVHTFFHSETIAEVHLLFTLSLSTGTFPDS